MRGVAPKTKFYAFQIPHLKYLNINADEQRRGAWQYDWSRPKAILPKARVSRGRWRMVSFADREGITCHHTFYGVWPSVSYYDEVLLAAVLNSPVANAFVAAHEGNRDITKEILAMIPMPKFSPSAAQTIHHLVARYEESINSVFADHRTQEKLLKSIDAAVIGAYRMPPRLERTVLDYFNDSDRKVAHPFSNYFPATMDVFVHLSDYLDEKFARSTVGNLLKKTKIH